MALHLTVFQAETKLGEVMTNANMLVDRRSEVRWNEAQSAFRVVRLLWWDDASYVAYQCGDED